MRTLLRKIGHGMLVAVVTVSFAGAFDLAWAKAKPNSNKPSVTKPQSNKFPPITSFTQVSNNRRDDGGAPGKGTDNPKGCASPPCRHHGHGHGHGHDD